MPAEAGAAARSPVGAERPSASGPRPESAGPVRLAARSRDGEPWQVRLYRRSIKKRETLRAALELLPPLAGKRCLEIECGSGITNWVLRQRGGVWTCVDSVPEHVGSARALLEDEAVHLVEGGELPFPAETFDVVVAINVLRHHQDDGAFFREIARVVRPGGQVLITTACGGRRRLGYRLRRAYGLTSDQVGGHGDWRDGYDRKRLLQLVASAGLRLERLETYSRIFTEVVENTLLYAYYRSMRRRPEIVERYPAGTWSVSQRTFEPAGWRFRLYAAIYPLLRAVSLLDRLIPFRRGYMFCLRAAKRES